MNKADKMLLLQHVGENHKRNNMHRLTMIEDAQKAFQRLTRDDIVEVVDDFIATYCVIQGGVSDNAAITNAASKMGAMKSDKKAAASRENGQKGGRPRKTIAYDRKNNI